MLPAQPPNSRLSVGTRKDTLSTCSWFGRIWSAKRPSNVAMLSKASEPQTRADMGSPERAAAPRPGSGIEDLDGVADDGGRAGAEDHRKRRLSARCDDLAGVEVGGGERAPSDQAPVRIGQGEVDRGQ